MTSRRLGPTPLASASSTSLLVVICRPPGIDNVFALLVAILHQTRCDGTWQRMRSCGNDGCQWAFYDRSRNASATWCSMTICGNRRKIRAYRARRAAA